MQGQNLENSLPETQKGNAKFCPLSLGVSPGANPDVFPLTRESGNSRLLPGHVVERWELCFLLESVITYLACVSENPNERRYRIYEKPTPSGQTHLGQARLRQTCLGQPLDQTDLNQHDQEQEYWETLKKAEWYLVQKIQSEQTSTFQERLKRHRTGRVPSPSCNTNASRNVALTPELVARNWGLPSRLEAVVFYIASFQKLFYQFPLLRVVCLKQALAHLQAEIAVRESLCQKRMPSPISHRPETSNTTKGE